MFKYLEPIKTFNLDDETAYNILDNSYLFYKDNILNYQLKENKIFAMAFSAFLRFLKSVNSSKKIDEAGFKQDWYNARFQQIARAYEEYMRILDENSLVGRKEVYTLAIPKGDTHDWENQVIEFWGKTWKSFGFPLEGIESNIPLAWNKKVTVERYE